jgi:hypothetical protein
MVITGREECNPMLDIGIGIKMDWVLIGIKIVFTASMSIPVSLC